MHTTQDAFSSSRLFRLLPILFLLGTAGLLGPQGAPAQVPQQFVNAPVADVEDVHPTDVDGDGNVDLVAASKLDVNLGLFQGNGNGTFDYRAIPLDRNARSVHAADLDEDSVEEILAARSKTTANPTSTITWYDPDGSGSFTADTVAANIDSPEDLDAADLDDDGTTDVIAATVVLESTITWYKKDGSGSFTADTIGAGPGSFTSVDAADFDGGEDTDVIAGGSDGVFWYENDGSESFTSHTIAQSSSLGLVNDVHATDVNGDGKTDVIVPSVVPSEIRWYKNNGSGSFTGHTVTTRVTDPTVAIGTDLNGDGMTDILSSSLEGKIAWYENTESTLIPVELATFQGRQTGSGTVRLTWATASETNNAGFALQHKAPTENTWTKQGFVESTAAGGTTTEAQSYQFTTEDLSVGTHQFRLKQVDLDGTTHVSRTVTVKLGLDQPVRLTAPAPNPVQNRATLSFAVKEPVTTTVTLYNVLGRQVATLYRGTPTAGEAQALDLSATGLSSGIYFLRLQAGERTKTRRVTVVK